VTPDDLPEGGPSPVEDGEERRRGKGFKARKREDHALVLIRDLLASLGGAIVEVRHQREIMEAIEAGRLAEAEALVQARYALYIKDRAHLGRGEDSGLA